MNNEINLRSRRFSELLGLELKGLFSSKGTTQTKVADGLGHSRTAFSKWLKGERNMPVSVFFNICEMLNADPGKILDRAYLRLIEEKGSLLESGTAREILRQASPVGEGSKDESDADAILKSFIKDKDSGKFETAALHDVNQKQESEGGDGR